MKAIFFPLFACLLAYSLSGCVSQQTQRLDAMSDKSICELLGPGWSSSPEERNLLRRELESRGVICDQGRILTSRQPPWLGGAKANRQGELNVVRLKKESGVYKVPVKINDAVIVNLILDSGAADMMLSPQVANILLQSGTLTKDDFLPGQVYRLADGSKKKHMRARLRSVTLGKRTFRDVTFSIAGADGTPMLLGQSLLEKMGKYTIDYHNSVLLFE